MMECVGARRERIGGLGYRSFGRRHASAWRRVTRGGDAQDDMVLWGGEGSWAQAEWHGPATGTP
jgi:hypothetical protein